MVLIDSSNQSALENAICWCWHCVCGVNRSGLDLGSLRNDLQASHVIFETGTSGGHSEVSLHPTFCRARQFGWWSTISVDSSVCGPILNRICSITHCHQAICFALVSCAPSAHWRLLLLRFISKDCIQVGSDNSKDVSPLSASQSVKIGVLYFLAIWRWYSS